jgi:hypothetical protein
MKRVPLLSWPASVNVSVNALTRNVRRDRLLQFKPVRAVNGAVRMWAAANSEYAFRIALTHRFLAEAGEQMVYVHVPKPVFVAYVSFLDGSDRCQIEQCFKTFSAAVRKCSKFTREHRQQTAHHEAGHAVAARVLGFSGVWVNMKYNKYQAVTGWRRNNLTPAMLADGALLGGGGNSGDRNAFVRALQDELIIAVAGLVAEVRIAGYQTSYVEPEVPGRAIHLVRAASGLPIYSRGCKQCKVRFDHESILENGLLESRCSELVLIQFKYKQANGRR